MRKQLLLTVAALLAYGWSLSGSFHFDDYSLTANPSVTDAAGLWRMWGPLETRPLTNLTFWVNYHLGGANPVGYHAVNLGLHLAAVLLLYLALQSLLPELCAFWAAIIFAVHPMQSEAVAYVFARSTLLSTAFCLASLWFWLNHRWRWATALFLCALLSKEECVTFPLMLLLISGRTKQQIRRISVTMALALLAGIRVIWATAHVAGSGAGFTAGISPASYLLTQGSAILRYLRLVILPWGLTIEPTVAQSATSWSAVLAILAVAMWAFRKRYSWAVWVISAFILLIPSSTIFPAADLAADRRMYLPMVAFATAFGCISPWLWTQVPPAIASVLLLLSVARMEVWRTERNLWQEAAKRSPTHVRPLLQLARAVPQKDAIELLVQAKSLDPHSGAVSAELGRAWLLTGSYAFALQEFGRALALEPNNANAYNNRGAALLALKQEQAAKLDFERALRIDPCVEAARRNLQSLAAGPLPPCLARAK